MSFKVFYSWQSKTDTKYNRNFIQNCLEAALKNLKRELKDDSPDFYLDRDTKDVSGIPNIPTTIEGKIKLCDIFLADLSYIYPIREDDQEGMPAPNVLIELGYSLGSSLTEGRIITVMNIAYGNADKLSFDIKQRTFPITFYLDDDTAPEQKKVEKDKLASALKSKIELILRTEMERQKSYFKPFYTWKYWDKILKRDLKFEKTTHIDDLFQEIKLVINIPKTIIRLCGLSGIGKTRILFECFEPNNRLFEEAIINKILYVDVNDNDDKTIINTVKELIQLEENKILIIDNCSKQLHSNLISLITNENSKLSLITVSINPDERIEEIDSESITRMLILDNQLFKETVSIILTKNFSELQQEEKDLLVDFSSGISFFATLMATNPNRGKYQPGTLKRKDVVERLLGNLYTNEQSRAVIYACCLFSKIGFFDELKSQADNISQFPDLCDLKVDSSHSEDIPELKRIKFREVCKILNEKQLLEKKGRTYSFRPSPLAVRMAEEWWQNCTVSKFNRILPFLKDNNLVESFCEQFQYLKHLENAKVIVKDLCDGVFSLAEVLNTNVGSRLFRSFVYVNPIACVNALTKGFANKSIEELSSMVEGRRNLVWALEKLCFRDETFDDTAKVLAAFSVAENENIGNNATNQFLQLFHIYLPGTSVNLERRWNIIEYCVNNTEDYMQLGLKALSRGLTSDHFHRMGGAEEQGDIIPLKDYNPIGTEIWSYWKKIIEKLETVAIEKNQYSTTASNILVEKLYSLCVNNAGKLILPTIEKIFKEELIEKIDLRKKVQFILTSKRVYDSRTIERLKKLYDDLKPTSFIEQFKLIVESPSSDEYFDKEDNVTNSISIKIDKLALEFYNNKDDWHKNFSLLVSGNTYEGFNFGKSLSNHFLNDHEKYAFIELLLEEIKKIEQSLRNFSIVFGVLSSVKSEETQIKIFENLLLDKDLRYISFNVARTLELPFEIVSKLFTYVENKEFPSSAFSVFEYGWGLRHLKYEEVISILDRLRLIDSVGKTVAFFIISKWRHGSEEIWTLYKNQIRKQILEDSVQIFQNLKGTMDYFEWSSSVEKLLSDSTDAELAETCLSLIVDELNEFESFYNKEHSFQKILNILQEKYFSELWNGIVEVYLNIEKYGITALHFRDILGSRQDSYHHTEGILFKENPEKFKIVFEWSKANQGNEIHWIAELLPVYDINTPNIWHPYAKAFIDEFGNNAKVLSGISAKMGTYSWTGSVVPKLETDKILFEQLLDHKIETVRHWATIHSEDLNKRIHWEKNRDEDQILNF